MVGHLQSTLKINFYAFGKKGQQKATRWNTSELYQDLLRGVAYMIMRFSFANIATFQKKRKSTIKQLLWRWLLLNCCICSSFDNLYQKKIIFSKSFDFAMLFFSDWNSCCQNISKHNAQRLSKLCSWLNFFFRQCYVFAFQKQICNLHLSF